MKKLSCLLLAALLLLVSACGGGAVTASPTPTAAAPTASPSPSPSPTPTAEPTATPMPYVNPLTGVGMEEDISGQRPWAVMINNLDKALPQCGVSQADIVYEVPAEGGVTRMMAIFTDLSAVEKLGSMRSLRPYYADIGLSYDAIVVHAGGSQASYSELSAYGIDHLDGVLGSYASETFYRDPDRMKYGYEHSLFTTGENLIAAAQGQGFRLTHEDGSYDYRLSFSDRAESQCTGTAEYAEVKFNGYKSTSFTYDADTGLYSAYEYGADYVDGNSGDTMTFKNVLVLSTDIAVLDDVGRLSVRTTGTGDGYFLCGGKYVPITWERAANTDSFSYYLADGTELRLGVGTSYVGIMDDAGASLSFEQD